MAKVGMSYRWCQNCVYWTGQRKIDGTTKMTESLSNTGKCECQTGMFKCNVSHMNTCVSFKSIF